MKKHALWDWFKSYAMHWLFPKIGVVWAVYPLAGIILSTAIALHPDPPSTSVGRGVPQPVLQGSGSHPAAEVGGVSRQAPSAPLASAPDVSMQAVEKLVGVITQSTSSAQSAVYIAAVVVWLLVMMAKGYVTLVKPRETLSFRLSQLMAWATVGLVFVAGMFVVPLTVAWAVALQLPGGMQLIPTIHLPLFGR
ncbi:hypothetical protein [Roseateles amylovorans]|uniref:Uncharacterized protein n=1 Tax=Roseateles amylovorans TaxID=2978473 RepID=A0ABY6B1M0_9BURK|nr:hypothetical protein [Roseateles amylovorans]UXH79058.1 hypothetical protein N4261_03735 [Roseateles amylovorans]